MPCRPPWSRRRRWSSRTGASTSLSGGQRQRVWIATASWLQETDIVLLDEPTTFLDIAHQYDVLELASRPARRGSDGRRGAARPEPGGARTPPTSSRCAAGRSSLPGPGRGADGRPRRGRLRPAVRGRPRPRDRHALIVPRRPAA
ncbi:ATP-binding cassette domain-containing protein [Sphingomonas sp. LR61]|uniref:ATP-binding cassette domain-containing protein n=1 Tax=Sphingomonas sp. LR61 TaxID=3050234 RepID=UPI002FE427C4